MLIINKFTLYYENMSIARLLIQSCNFSNFVLYIKRKCRLPFQINYFSFNLTFHPTFLQVSVLPSFKSTTKVAARIA